MNAHTNPIFIQLEFLKIEDIRQFQLLSFVYDCLNKTAPVFFHGYFTPSSERHTYNTRLASRGDLFLERRNTFQYGIRSIEYNGARLWNMLPVTLRESSSPPVFQSDLKNTSYICIPVKLFQYMVFLFSEQFPQIPYFSIII